MRLERVNLQHFRNIPLASLQLEGNRHFLVGANGQGKTALLEAVGLVTALRSFRTADNRNLVSHGQTEAAVVYTISHEQRGPTTVTLRLKPGGKELWADQERVERLGDYLGRFPTVVFSSQDQQLIRGTPGLRRRWLDLTLAAMDARYLQALQGYHRALAGRNALLKQGAPVTELEAFEHPLAEHGFALVSARRAGLDALATDLTSTYAAIAEAAEPAGFAYLPDAAVASAQDLRTALASGRGRDLAFRTTQTGPHKDDFGFTLRGRAAKEFASEGQQRSLVLALKLAQAVYFQRIGGIRPVVLADDVLGELDPGRRRRFWRTLGPETQVIATGTTLPDDTSESGSWQIFQVDQGAFAPGGAA